MPHIHKEYDYTISVFILHPNQAKVLLVKHKKLGKLMQVGGHIELNEDPWQALSHELLEEAGLIIQKCQLLLQPDQPRVVSKGHKTLPIPFHYEVHDLPPDGSHRHIDMSYALKSYTDQIRPDIGESQEFEWVDQERLGKMNREGQVLGSTCQIYSWLFAQKSIWP